MALTASAKPEARKFLDFLLSSEAAAAFEAQGFSIQAKSGSTRFNLVRSATCRRSKFNETTEPAHQEALAFLGRP